MIPSLMDRGKRSIVWVAIVTRLDGGCCQAPPPEGKVVSKGQSGESIGVLKVKPKPVTMHLPPSLHPSDPSFSDDMSDMGSDGDGSRDPSEPAVKRERIEINHSLQEI